MHIVRRLVLCGASLFSTALQAGTIRSHSFFSLRPNFTSAMPERVSQFRNELLDSCSGVGGALEIVPFGGRTTLDGRNKYSQYFLPPGCITNFLRVKEYNPAREAIIENTDDGNPLKDLEARHFNIRTVRETFSSIICISPEQSVFGLGLCYKQTVSTKCNGTPGFWVEISVPIERVVNRMNLDERVLDNGGGPRDEIGLDNSPRVGNMIDALKQPNWQFGKILQCKQIEWGIADVELKVGYNSYNCDTYTLASYGTLVIPSGTRVRGETLFEPIVGNNHHFGFSLGTSYAWQVWCKNHYTVHMFLDNNTRYLFSNNQVRMFDPIGKPWGRYMETYATSEDAAFAARTNNQNSGTSGINVFTDCVRVNPHLNGTFNTAIAITRHGACANFIFEGGYNLFVRQSEHIEFDRANKLNRVALKAVNGEGRTTLARNIKDNFPRSEFTIEQRYAAVTNCEIDVESATHVGTVSNTIYGMLAYRYEQDCPSFFAVAASYEFTNERVNVAPDRWLVWLKYGTTF